ncbi:MAG: hypothetical protein CSB55_08200 [Candidatus Cloacimonadota bacterium]|nr:MAG: hypothetical protein CSB55_08200 [Candidatus Cloacimonadota bacterium]
MKKRRNVFPKILRFLIIVSIISLIYVLYSQNKELKNRLQKIKIFDVQNDTMLIRNGLTVKDTIYVRTNEYLKEAHKTYSPFGGEETIDELISQYIHIYNQDKYGARRRTGEFRRWHEGIDLFVPRHTQVYPVCKTGIVTDVSDDPNYMIPADCVNSKGDYSTVDVEYGKIVRIVYPEGFESLYAHLDSVFVKKGQMVDNNTVVGLTGVTGNLIRSGKPSHLHIELRDENGKSFDPKKRLNYKFPDSDHYLEYITY